MFSICPAAAWLASALHRLSQRITTLSLQMLITFVRQFLVTFGPWRPSPEGPIGPGGPGLPMLPFKQMKKMYQTIEEM